MARHIIMDPSGHSTFAFDPSNKADLAKAERRLNELVSKGYMPAYHQGQHRVPQDRVFDPSADETIFIPALRGG